MNLCEELTMKSNEIEAKRKEVYDEIMDDFAKYISSGKLEEHLRGQITDDVLKKRKLIVGVGYMPHSEFKFASFRCCGYVWEPVGVPRSISDEYKGVSFSDIEENVCSHMCKQLINGLHDFGFKQVTMCGAKMEPHYYNRITIEW